MLDLTVIQGNLYEIRLLDGTELKLKRPSQAMIQYLIEIQSKSGEANEAEILKMFAQLFTRILNRNTENKIYKTEDIINEYDFSTIGYVLQDYMNYWNQEVADEVDFQATQQ